MKRLSGRETRLLVLAVAAVVVGVLAAGAAILPMRTVSEADGISGVFAAPSVTAATRGSVVPGMTAAPSVTAAASASAPPSGTAAPSSGAPTPITTRSPRSGPPPTVAADGTGRYRTVQAAIDAVPAGNVRTVTITIKPGTYRE